MDSVIQFEGTIYEDGYGLLAQKVMRDRTLKGQSKLIYAYMCSFASIGKSGDRIAFPSVSLQCAELSMSEDTYYKWRKPLIDKGYIKITKQRQEGAKFDNNIYSIMAVPAPLEKKIVDLEGERPYPKKSGMENKPYPNFPSTENPCTEKQGTNSNIFNSNIFNNNKREEEEETHISELVSLFSECIAPANRIVKKELVKWLGLLPFEVIKAEIENAAAHGGKTWKYIERSLLEDKQKKLHTAADVNNRVAEYESRKKMPIKSNRRSSRTEILPDWFDKDENVEKLQHPKNTNDELLQKQREINEKFKALGIKAKVSNDE